MMVLYSFFSKSSYELNDNELSGMIFFNDSNFFASLENKNNLKLLSFEKNETRFFPICPVEPKMAIFF